MTSICGDHRFDGVDLAGARLRNLDLSGTRFEQVNLSGTVMRGVELFVPGNAHSQVVTMLSLGGAFMLMTFVVFAIYGLFAAWDGVRQRFTPAFGSASRGIHWTVRAE